MQEFDKSAIKSRILHQGKDVRSVALFLVVVFAIGLSTGAQAANQYRALYYSADWTLLQVEEVPDQEFKDRKKNLEDIDQTSMVIPLLTTKTAKLLHKGVNEEMHRLARYAVYYTYEGEEPGDGKELVQAKPKFVEELTSVPNRVLKSCLARDGNDPCAYPKRCHCLVNTCCCY